MPTNINLYSVSKEIQNNDNPKECIPSSLRYIDTGTDRIVYEIDRNTVVKFSLRPADNINQTSREIHFYNQLEKRNCNIINKFAKIKKYSKNSYLCQEYLDTDRPISSEQINEFRKKAKDHGITIHDDRKQNFGYRNKELVMLDYAGCFFN